MQRLKREGPPRIRVGCEHCSDVHDLMFTVHRSRYREQWMVNTCSWPTLPRIHRGALAAKHLTGLAVNTVQMFMNSCLPFTGPGTVCTATPSVPNLVNRPITTSADAPGGPKSASSRGGALAAELLKQDFQRAPPLILPKKCELHNQSDTYYNGGLPGCVGGKLNIKTIAENVFAAGRAPPPRAPAARTLRTHVSK